MARTPSSNKPLSKGDRTRLETKIVEEIKKVDSISLRQKGNLDFVMRNLALACWVLQRRSLSVRRVLLKGLIGYSQIERATELLNSEEFREYILKENDHAILFSEEFMEAVEAAYDIEEYHFGLTRPVPYFDRQIIRQRKRSVPGYKFIEYINLLLEGDEDTDEKQPTQEELLILLVEAFKHAVIGVDGEIHPDYPVARIYRQDESWNFLLTVYPNKTMLLSDDIYKVVAHISAATRILEQTGKHHNLKTLFISPAIDKQADADFIRELPNVYHCWSVSVLRFFNMLKEINESPDISRERISDNFLSIFPSESTSKFSSREAIDRLKKKCEVGSVVLPFKDLGVGASGWNYSLVFSDSRSSSSRNNQPDHPNSDELDFIYDLDDKYINLVPQIVMQNNEQFVCRVIPADDFKPASGQHVTGPLTYEEFKNLLDANKIDVIHLAISKYKDHLRSDQRR